MHNWSIVVQLFCNCSKSYRHNVILTVKSCSVNCGKCKMLSPRCVACRMRKETMNYNISNVNKNFSATSQSWCNRLNCWKIRLLFNNKQTVRFYRKRLMKFIVCKNCLMPILFLIEKTLRLHEQAQNLMR